MTSNTVLQVASVSKFVTGVATLKLVERNKFSLDTDVNDYLTNWKVKDNEFTKAEKVTLRRIMSHTAGLNVPTFPGYSEGMAVPTITEILNGASPANTQPICVGWLPETKESYSGGGTTVEQLILEEYAKDVFNLTFEKYMEKEVLKPIGMNSSTFETRDRSNLDGIATGHVCKNNHPQELSGFWHTYPEKAAAGMYATASDIARFLIHVARAYNGESDTILGKDMVRKMLTVQLPKGRFGLGATLYGTDSLQDVWFGHEGSNKGYCLQGLASTGGNGVVIITNGDCLESSAENLIIEILRTIFEVYGWIPKSAIEELFPYRFHIWPRLHVQPPHNSPQDYEGTYKVDGVVPDELFFDDVYYITANTITSSDVNACSFRLWAAANSENEFVTDMWYRMASRPVIQFLRGNFKKVNGMELIYGEKRKRYNRQESEL